jgi:flavin-dependent dehydrogenase
MPTATDYADRPAHPHDFDVVIVGASFAGAACAIAAAQRGLRVVVLERKRDPGAKLHTTGIIVKEAAEQTLLIRVPATMTRRVEQVRLYAPNLQQVALAAPGYYFLTTDTPSVMRWLAEQLRVHSVDLRLGCAFTDATPIGEGWRVDGVAPRASWSVPTARARGLPSGAASGACASSCRAFPRRWTPRACSRTAS